jgi:hypothetical protein
MNSKAKTQKYIVVTIEALASSFPRLADPELTRLEVATGMGEPTWESYGSIGWEREHVSGVVERWWVLLKIPRCDIDEVGEGK